MKIVEPHLMIDIETLDTRPSAVVLSVGVALFDSYEVLKSYHWTLKLGRQINAGRTIDDDTLAWWVSQEPEIMRQAFTQEHDDIDVLEQLNAIVAGFGVTHLWAHSPAFDYVILDSLWDRLEKPWNHKSWLDTRTLSWMTGKTMKRGDGHHNAERDAVVQAEWVIEALQ